MKRRIITLAWLIVGACLLGETWSGAAAGEYAFGGGQVLLGLVGIAAWLYLGLRLAGFRRRLLLLLGRLAAGEYDSGIKTRRLPDEVRDLEERLNRVVAQLARYDVLRAARVALSYRTLDLVHRNAGVPMMIADAGKETLRFNPQAQALLGIDADRLDFETLRAQKGNAPFYERLMRVIHESKAETEAAFELQMPGSRESRRVMARIMPVKDHEENVQSALIMLSPLAAEGKAPE